MLTQRKAAVFRGLKQLPGLACLFFCFSAFGQSPSQSACQGMPNSALTQPNGFLRVAFAPMMDPLGIKSAANQISQRVQATMIQLNYLRKCTNYDIKNRIDQLQDVVKEALSGEKSLIEKANSDAAQLERNVDMDAIRLIYRAECAGINVEYEEIDVFGKILNELKSANIHVNVAGLNVGKIKQQKIAPYEANEAYWAFQKAENEYLQSAVGPDFPAYKILDVYQNLERTAFLTSCMYQLGDENSYDSITFIKEANKYQIKTKEWTQVVSPITP